MSPESLYIESPLYQKFEAKDGAASDLLGSIVRFEGVLDMYCPKCESKSIFAARKGISTDSSDGGARFPFNKVFVCSRNKDHRAIFNFYCEDDTVTKIGQYPSIADLNASDVDKYRSVLSGEKRAELMRGLGLASHGVGIGAFVYLRRIFEGQIEEARLLAQESDDWDSDKFLRMRMDEKIKSLEEYLPEVLVEHRRLYGIMSFGVHELSEQRCNEAFFIVKSGIELILDEKLEKKRSEEKRRKLTAEISRFEAG